MSIITREKNLKKSTANRVGKKIKQSFPKGKKACVLTN